METAFADSLDCVFPMRTLRHRGIRRVLQQRPTRHSCPEGVETERAPQRTLISAAILTAGRIVPFNMLIRRSEP